MGRWRMHKLGFVNFWLYDREEFFIEDGRILLRGANASGKSITTQSFLPFILDGNRSPERLDPFGSRDRKMDFYLLGDGDREESTGYLYLEFQKDGMEAYLTIGVGMRAQRGKQIDFWGFCLNDGRRIGAEGLPLYEAVGGQLIPLSKQKLKNSIGKSDCWAESPGTYKEMVNKQVFRFADIRQYEQLVHLLIKVRAPKLSKETFRPSEVKKILNESLQVLTDEDLSAMVSTMERMDAVESKLQDHHAAKRDAMIIRNEYERYNQFILGGKAGAYLDAITAREKMGNQCKDTQADLAFWQKEHDTQCTRAEEAGRLFAQAKAQRTAMGEDDLSVKQSQLEGEQESIHAQEAVHRDSMRGMDGIRDEIEKNEVKLRQYEQARKDAVYTLQGNTKKLQEQELCLALGEVHRTYLAQLQAGGEAELGQIQGALSSRAKQITGMIHLLEKVGEAHIRYDDSCGQLDGATTAHTAAKVHLRDAQSQEQEERDQLTEELVRRRSANQELLFSDDALFVLRQAVVHYRSPADWSSVRAQIEDCYQKHGQILFRAQLQVTHTLEEQAAHITKLERELAKLRSQPNPIPLRRSQLETTRALLTMRGIPHGSFYEAVDFRADLSQEARDRLEAQLTDMGLLDGLLVPETHRKQLLEQFSDSPDFFLVPGPPVLAPLDALVPDSKSPMAALAAQCLRGISCVDIEAQTAILPDGSYRNGILQGCSIADHTAGFVGATARRANLERQLREREGQLEQANEEQARTRTDADALSRRIACLDEERSFMPTTADLDQARDMLAQASRTEAETETAVRKYEAEEQVEKCRLNALEQESRSLSADLPYTRTTEAYQEAQEAADCYRDILQALGTDWGRFENARSLVEQLEDSIASQRDQLGQQMGILRQTEHLLAVARAKAGELRAYLEQPENRERAQRMQTLSDEIDTQDKARRIAENQCAALVEKIATLKGAVAGYQESLTNFILEEHELEQYFAEELELGFPKSWDSGSLPDSARQAKSKISARDRAYSPEEMSGSLRRNYESHNNGLLSYMPKLELVFDSPIKPGMLRQRQLLTLQKEGKQLSLYAFIDALQDEINLTEMVLEAEDRRLFEDILHETISHKLRARIEESQQWSRDMSALMKTLVTSMGLHFGLEWRAKRAENEDELDTADLVQLLNKDRRLLTMEDSKRAAAHFRRRIRKAREEGEERGFVLNYGDMIREVLDYRTWYEFFLYYQRSGEEKKELTDRVFNRFSGGEKAMAIYVPQFAAVSAQYQKGDATCPMLLALDEAFAGVDDKNIDAMFELVHQLGFDYIMNSQALWGCYSCVPSLDIADFHRPNNAQVVTILRYHWNGREKILQEG